MNRLKKPVLILVVGKSGSGKDYIVDEIIEIINKTYIINNPKRLKKVLSRTSRKPRKNEKNTHIFVDEETALKNKSIAVAFTYFNKNYYYTLKEDLDEAMFYIIDKSGIEYFEKTEYYDNYDILSVQITCPLYKRLYRMIKRDGISKAVKRVINDFFAFRGVKTDLKMSNKNAKKFLILEILSKVL